MMISFFLIFTKLCFQHEIISQQDASTHIINFNFDKLTCNPKSFTNVKLNRIKEDVSLSEIPIKSMFFGTNGSSINIVVENLLNDELLCTGFFHITFYKDKESYEDKVYNEYVFEIGKMGDGLLKIVPKTPKWSILYLEFVFNRYFKKIYEKDEKFLTVPKSNVLCTKRFVANHKDKLKNYFETRKGLRQTIISLNDCLSQIKEPKDIPVQIENFFNERRDELARINEFRSRFGEHMETFDIEDSLIRMMIDVLILLERCTDVKSDYRYGFLVHNNISTFIKAVKEFPIPDSLYKKKKSTIILRILPDQQLYTYFEKDLWFTRNKLYVSRDLCDTCRELNSSLEIFNLKEEKKVNDIRII
ncbi:hypothetical protein NBO_717g0002 [Nosema bombycis CQ1]|uniref:Uncharacterized protein n=1 Tax=Nosema bombycis (strain CQ1 / CVCC 102059) TaxID=578461 RepID=R0MCV7_NOSB1|nr:hypothetical protein NBO_717g0002 [Nosema bombycis CQ1]|eukprot:EOB11860.1 hypothetical protein NBO_717g0002 [Nosema bombycis CQ1]